jgi:hypothetical protein
MSYDSESNKSDQLSDAEDEDSELDNQPLTKKEKREEKKYLQNDI